jgi:hypothetical protein
MIAKIAERHLVRLTAALPQQQAEAAKRDKAIPRNLKELGYAW